MDECVKDIYLYWVGLGKTHDIKGLPLPIPIKDINSQIIVDKEYFKEHGIELKQRDNMKQIASRYEYNRLMGITGG